MKIGLSITLGRKDKTKLDRLALAEEISRSEVIRELIRSKRLPKDAEQSCTGLQRVGVA